MFVRFTPSHIVCYGENIEIVQSIDLEFSLCSSFMNLIIHVGN